MPLAQKMPETPEDLVTFIRSVVDDRMVGLHQEVLQEVRRLGERQARIEGRLEGVEKMVEAYREDIKGFRHEMKSFQIEARAENEKFRQEVNARFTTIEGRLFEMQKALTTQTRWLLSLLVAVPVIYSLMQKLL